MITPNKFIALDQSILARLDVILEGVMEETSIRDLYKAAESRFDTADQFLLALDVLYILGRIQVNFRTATVMHAH